MDSPIQLHPGPGGSMKIKRGGTGKISNSGTVRRVRPPVRAIRDPKGKHLPWPPRGKPIWDPRDPFIVAYRARRISSTDSTTCTQNGGANFADLVPDVPARLKAQGPVGPARVAAGVRRSNERVFFTPQPQTLARMV